MATRSLEILKAMAVRGGVVSRTLEDGGVVRVKILIKRGELEQVIKGRVHDNKENHVNRRQLSRSLASKSLKAPVEVKRVSFDLVNLESRSHWRPALQSIPEEF